mgnify:CR=1 FL=1
MEDKNKVSPLSAIKPSQRLNRRLSNKKRDRFAEEFSLFYEGDSKEKQKKARKRRVTGAVDQYI